MASIQGSVVVQFDGESVDTSDYLFSAEIDNTLNVDANGDVITSFIPGDVVYIAVNHSTNIKINSVVATNGSLSLIGSQSRSDSEILLYSSRDSKDPTRHELSKRVSSVTHEFFGRTGSVSYDTDEKGITTAIGNVDTTPFITKTTLNYPVTVYRLATPEVSLSEDETYPIAVVFYLSKV